jgi:DNA-binding transcriptional ArsR family regulator
LPAEGLRLAGLTFCNNPVTYLVTYRLLIRRTRLRARRLLTLGHKRREAVFRAIADPTRREILGLLRGGRCTVGEIAVNFRSSRPAISRHLRLLRSVGLVVTRREGTARICELNAKPLRAVNDWLRDYQAFWGDSLEGLKRYVEEDR